MVAAVQASLLFQNLKMGREEILAKYPINNMAAKAEALEEGSREAKQSKDQMQDSQAMHATSHPYDEGSAEQQQIMMAAQAQYFSAPPDSEEGERAAAYKKNKS